MFARTALLTICALSLATPQAKGEVQTVMAAAPASLEGEWSTLGPPYARYLHSAIYDPLRNRMVVFGGSSFNDTWVLRLDERPGWRPLATSGTPPAWRKGHSAVYDPVRDRMLVFGGAGVEAFNDTWALSLGDDPTWSPVQVSGDLPPPTYQHCAVYDPVGDRLVVFGGAGPNGESNDTWELRLADPPAWRRLDPSGTLPHVRSDQTAIYDPIRQRMLVFGGNAGGDPYANLNDCWALSLTGPATWTELVPVGVAPSGRRGMRAIYDPAGDRMVSFGGYWKGYALDDTWTLSLGGSPSWKRLSAPDPPTARYDCAAIYSPERQTMIVFGGSGPSSALDDTWALPLAGPPNWTELSTLGTPPNALTGETAIAANRAMLVFGGLTTAKPYTNDAWFLSRDPAAGWHLLSPYGVRPSGRYEHTAIYDSARNRMVVFGGWDGHASLDDTWVLSLGTAPAWSQVVPVGLPPSGRYEHVAVYDPLRDRMIVFGGFGIDGSHNDTWALSFSGTPAWTQLTIGGRPPSPRHEHAAIYDPVRDRIIVFGGAGDEWGDYLNDTWELSLGAVPTWTRLYPAGDPPAARYQHSAIYEAARDRIIVFGGESYGVIQADTWALSLSDPMTWSKLSPAGVPPGARTEHVAVYDVSQDRMVLFGGGRNDTWLLDWLEAQSRPPAVLQPAATDPNDDFDGQAVWLGPVYPNPASGPVTIVFGLPSTQRVRLSVYDVAGRCVAVLVNTTARPGVTAVRWNARENRSRGIYWCRLETAGSTLTTKFVLSR